MADIKFSDSPDADGKSDNKTGTPSKADPRDAELAELRRRLDERDAADSARSEANKPKEAKPAEFYVHLANGEVVRVKEDDVPTSAGTNATNGYHTKDGNVFFVTGVYPVESKAGM